MITRPPSPPARVQAAKYPLPLPSQARYLPTIHGGQYRCNCCNWSRRCINVPDTYPDFAFLSTLDVPIYGHQEIHGSFFSGSRVNCFWSFQLPAILSLTGQTAPRLSAPKFIRPLSSHLPTFLEYLPLPAHPPPSTDLCHYLISWVNRIRLTVRWLLPPPKSSHLINLICNHRDPHHFLSILASLLNGLSLSLSNLDPIRKSYYHLDLSLIHI